MQRTPVKTGRGSNSLQSGEKEPVTYSDKLHTSLALQHNTKIEVAQHSSTSSFAVAMPGRWGLVKACKLAEWQIFDLSELLMTFLGDRFPSMLLCQRQAY